MKKSYLFLIGFSFVLSNSFSQNTVENQMLLEQEFKAIDADNIESFASKTKQKFKNKALSDTLHYEPFTGALPAGYWVGNLMSNNFIWTWNTVNQASGTIGIPRIKSSTGATGFMSLPISFYNSSSNVSMNTFFESPKITITPSVSVHLQYQMYLALCCSASDDFVLEVSTDSINWDSYDLSQGLAINAPNADTATAVTFETINLSPTLANESEFWYRVLVDGPVGYFVMLDDFAFVEGACNDLALENPYLEFNETNYDYNPTYSQIPCQLFPPLPFSGTIASNGGCTQTGVELNAVVTHVNTPGGGPATGIGVVYSSSATIGALGSLMDSSITTGSPRFTPPIYGSFQVGFSVTSDSIDQVPNNQTASRIFAVTDTIFAKDDNVFEGSTGPASFVDFASSRPGGTTVGDRFGTMYILENKLGHHPNNIPTSVSFWVSNNPRNIGVTIVPKIWEYDESLLTGGVNAAFGNAVASSFLPYTVTASDTNSLLTLPFNSGSALSGNGLDSGQYIVGWEVSTLAPGTTFEVANDASTAAIQPRLSTFLYLAHAPATGWGWVDVNPVIRLNMGNMLICSITSSVTSNDITSIQFKVSPNPSNGQLKLSIESKQNRSCNLNVRNMLGQVVYTSTIIVSGPTMESLDLSGLEKGIYFISLENENEKLVKKVVLK